MNVELAPVTGLDGMDLGPGKLIADWTVVVGELAVAVVDLAETPQHPDEGDIIDQEDVRFPDRGDLGRGDLWRRLAVGAAIEGPGRAERAVPRATAGELDSGARIERADEVLVAAAGEVAGGRTVVDAVQHAGRGPGAVGGDYPREPVQVSVPSRPKPAGSRLSRRRASSVLGAERVWQLVSLGETIQRRPVEATPHWPRGTRVEVAGRGEDDEPG